MTAMSIENKGIWIPAIQKDIFYSMGNNSSSYPTFFIKKFSATKMIQRFSLFSFLQITD
jgi:ABC-type Fe2+-enterobactin transport system substrate-binding protein